MSLTEHSPRPVKTGFHRCFYAVGFNDEVVASLQGLIAELGAHNASIRWVPDENIHLTLRFLGELTDAEFEAAQAVNGANTCEPSMLCASGLGAFPGLRVPKIIWAGVDGATPDDLAGLRQLQSLTEGWAQSIGLAPERRPFRPHVTLGRLRRPLENLRALVEDVIARQFTSPSCLINTVVLMKTHMMKEGSAYETVREWELGG